MAVVFDNVAFSAKLDSFKKNVTDKFKAQLKNAINEEAKSKLGDNNPNDASAYKRFYNSVIPAGDFKKDIIPEDVYKAIMLEAAVRDKTISKGFDIGNLDGKTVSAVASWFQGIFGKKTMTVGKYKVTMQNNYSAQVKFPSGNTYSVTWTLDDTAKNALKAYIADLKDYLIDYRYQIYGAIVKDGMSSLIREFVTEMSENFDSAKEKLITGFHDWALNSITETGVDVTINKILPETYKQITSFGKNYKTFMSRLDSLKEYAAKVSDDSIKGSKQYKNFISAYEKLGFGDYVDTIDKYMSYQFLNTAGGVFDYDKALITGTADDNTISATGSSVTIKGGAGDDFILSNGNRNKIAGETGNDKIVGFDYYSSISGGAGNDSIVVDGHKSTILGGKGNDYVVLYGTNHNVSGGSGNDLIYLVNATDALIKYSKGDGNDTVYGYDEGNELKIDGNTYSTQTSGQDVVIAVGKSSITLVDAVGKKININKTTETIGKSGIESTSYSLPDGLSLPSSLGTAKHVINGTNGDDDILNHVSNTLVKALSGNDTISNKEYNSTIDGGSGKDSISNSRAYVSIDGGDDDDYIINYLSESTFNISTNGGRGNDTLTNFYYYGIDNMSGGIILDGGEGDDSLYSSSANIPPDFESYKSTLEEKGFREALALAGVLRGGSGNDTICYDRFNTNGSALIEGNEGADLISIRGGSDIWINGGGDNDTIYAQSISSELKFEYASGDGNDEIHLDKVRSTSIEIQDHSFGVIIDENDMFLTVGKDSITVKDYNDANLLLTGNSLSGGVSLLGNDDNDKFSNVKVNFLIDVEPYAPYSPSVRYINTYGGNDYIWHETSKATILGGAGNDSIYNEGESSEVYGEDGNDIIGNYHNNKTTLEGGSGNDSILNTGSTALILGGTGDDTISNSGGAVSIDSGAGNDSILNTDSAALIFGGTGDDTISNSGDAVSINGGAGNDLINFFTESWSNKTMTVDVSNGKDTVSLDASNFEMYDTFVHVHVLGFGGGDEIKFSESITSLDSDKDLLVATVDKVPVTIGGLTFAKWSVKGGVAFYNPDGVTGVYLSDDSLSIRYNNSAATPFLEIDGVSDVENFSIDGATAKLNVQDFSDKVSVKSNSGKYDLYLCGSLKGSSTFMGTKENDRIRNGVDNIEIDTGSGRDSIENYGDYSNINANAGNDSVVNNYGNYATIDAGSGNDSILNYYSDYASLLGGEGNDYFFSNDLSDNVTIIGGAGKDTIENYSAGAKILGGTGNDSIESRNSNATLSGGDGNDYIINEPNYHFSSSRSDSVSIDGGAGNDTIESSGSNNTINAGLGNDSIYVSGINNLFMYTQGDGKDKIIGFDVTDTLQIKDGTYSTIKSGSDIIVSVDKGKITLVGAASLSKLNIVGTKESEPARTLTLTNSTKSPVTLTSAIKVANASKRSKAIKITGNALDNTIIGGSKADTIYGGVGNDSIAGNAGNDKLYGNASNDTLWGGSGNDSLWGDAGADTFFYAQGDGKDVIFGFDSKDTLTLDGLDFSTSYSKKNNAITFKVDGGSVTPKEFGKTTTFHVNNDIYKISGTKLIKK